MLNGVGGASVAEAKERISYAEALQWQAYVEKRGTINLGLRLEVGFALLAWTINRALGGKAEMSDFMPHFDEPDATLADVMTILTGAKN